MNKTIERAKKIIGIVSDINKKYNTNINIIYDIGANVGIYSILFNKLLNNSKIYSFEPVKKNFNVLKKNIDNFKLNNKIIPFNYGISINNLDEELQLSIPTTRESENTGLYSIKIKKIYQKDSVLCKFKPLSYFNLEIPDFIKMDVEGCEEEIILHNQELYRKVKVLMIEIVKDNRKKGNHFYIKHNNNIFKLLEKLNFVQVNKWCANYYFLNKKYL